MVDDDFAIPEKWRYRISQLGDRLNVRSFGSAMDFRRWSSTVHDWRDVALLFDLRLNLGEEDGIILASTVPTSVPKWIVTSNWSDTETVGRCKAQNLRLLSKDLLQTVPIRA